MHSTKETNVIKLNSTAYIFEAMFDYLITILISGAYLAKLTTTIGISDVMTAVLSSVTSLGAMFQILSIFLAHKTPVKRWLLPATFIPQMLTALLYLIPFLNIGYVAPFFFFIIILINNASRNIVAPAKSDWFLSPIETRKRGNFQATMSIVSIIGSAILTTFAGFLIDRLEADGKLGTMFIILTGVIFILSVMQLLCLTVAKETHKSVEKKEAPFKSVKNLVKNKIFIRFIVINTLWAIASSLTLPFLGTYEIKELGFSMSFISIVTIALNFVNIIALYVFGRISVKRSYSSLFFIAFIFGFVGFTLTAFTTPQNGQITFILYRIFNTLYSAMSGICITPLIFAMVDEDKRTSAIAFRSIITGLFGFGATLLVTPLFSSLQNANITVLGYRVFAQQILAVISAAITLIILVYYALFCRGIRNFENKI